MATRKMHWGVLALLGLIALLLVLPPLSKYKARPQRLQTVNHVAGVSFTPHSDHRQLFLNAPKLVSAVRAFSRDRTARDRKLPEEVSLGDLLRGGYLTTNDVAAFEGMEVMFSTQTDETSPQRILARARMPDGQFICLLADGSVQQFTASRLKEALRTSGQQLRGTE